MVVETVSCTKFCVVAQFIHTTFSSFTFIAGVSSWCAETALCTERVQGVHKMVGIHQPGRLRTCEQRKWWYWFWKTNKTIWVLTIAVE
jgi:hypothetical protein